MAIEVIKKYHLGDMSIIYQLDTKSEKTGFIIIPSDMEQNMVLEKKRYELVGLVQAKIVGDRYSNSYSNGITMRNNDTTDKLKYDSQEVAENEKTIRIKTILKDNRGYEAIHYVTYYKGEESFEVQCEYGNHSNEAITLEMLSSFELGGLTPFEEKDAPDTMLLHRLRSKWSHEGRLHTETIEDLQLEPSYAVGYAIHCERFGARGSLPVHKFFPFAAIEDKKNKVLWGAQLAHESSWQMEVYRRDECLHLSGGIADREFGHWMKELRPGESIITPKAILSVCEGDIDILCQRLTAAGKKHVDSAPEIEQDLPIVFNEYCTTWGKPTEGKIEELLKVLKGKGFTYFVIDAGWFKAEGVPWDTNMGDYIVSKEAFPSGMEKTVKNIVDAGMKPGIWFEIDNIGVDAKAYHMTEHQLHKDGHVLTSFSRRFWNMSDPWVIDYLTERVIGTMKDNGFEYLKMDYNDTIGIGCDGAESLGEGLRKDREASVAFVKKIAAEIPGIVIENCASGGHKLEPLMMGMTSMASFSDAHETEEIPIIAANLHRAILPRQSQIWAVIRQSDSLKRVAYSMANTFLGRMCLSGDVENLSDEQWKLIDDGMAFYKNIAPIIRDGFTRRYGTQITSERHPKGWQAVVRTGDNGEILVVVHCFLGELPEQISVPLPEGTSVQIEKVYTDGEAEISVKDGMLVYKTRENMQAVAVWLK